MSRLVVTVSGTGGPPGIAPPIVGIDTNNNLTINGVPTLLVQAAHCSYFFFVTQAGYTEAQSVAKIQQMKAAGVNCGESGTAAVASLTPPWNAMSDNSVMWFRHGIYGAGTGGNITTPPAPEQTFAALQAVMAGDLNQPYLLTWRASGEYEPTSDIPTSQTYLRDHISQMRRIDPAHLVVYSYCIGEPFKDFLGNWVGAQGLQGPFYEYAPGKGIVNSPDLILKPFPFFTLMNIGVGYATAINSNPLNVIAHPEGVGYTPGISYTWCTELFEKYQPNYPPSADELDRLFWLQVAMNAKAFNIYNGAALRQASFTTNLSSNAQVYISSAGGGADTQTVYLSGLAADGVTEISENVVLGTTGGQGPGAALSANTYSAVKFSSPVFPSLANALTYRQGGSGGTILGQTSGSAQGNAICGLGDLGLPPGMLAVWNTLWDWTMTNITSLTGILLAPGRWTQITAVTPAWSPPNFDFSSASHTAGIYAAKKSYGGALYVIAVNMDMQWNSGPMTTTDNAIASGVIDVGQAINTVTRLFEGGSPSFSGSQITGEAFRIAQVHVYRVT